jgi:hypothetical protein
MDTARFEQGGPYDDVIISLQYDEIAVTVIKSIPAWARIWDAATRTWRIHPSYAKKLAITLQRLGYQIVGYDLDGAAA